VWVALHRGDGARTLDQLPSGKLRDLLTGEVLTGPNVSVPARGARLLVEN
jgi:hypothetical protein